MMRKRREPDVPGATTHIESVRNVLGLLLAGFVGTLNIVGLKSHELTTVLRNESGLANLVAILFFGALVTAVGSVLVRGRHRLNVWSACAVLAFVLALVPLSTVVALALPAGSRSWLWWMSLAVSVGLAFSVVVLFFKGRSCRQARRVPWQSLLLACAAILSSTAAYTAIRLEGKSQLDATRPQMSASLKGTREWASLEMSISASKLTKFEKVGVLVRGLPRKEKRNCNDKHMARCVVHVCQGRASDHCTHLLSAALEPDSAGVISNQVLSVQFPTAEYQLVDARAEICEQQGSKTCGYHNKLAMVFFEVPGPVNAPSPSTKAAQDPTPVAARRKQ
ncbi:hypothetical protein ACWCQL_30095 [Streptomyces sp. NPDC002073]